MKNVTVPTNPNATAVQNAFAALLPYAKDNGCKIEKTETETINRIVLHKKNLILNVGSLPQIKGFSCFTTYSFTLKCMLVFYEKNDVS